MLKKSVLDSFYTKNRVLSFINILIILPLPRYVKEEWRKTGKNLNLTLYSLFITPLNICDNSGVGVLI